MRGVYGYRAVHRFANRVGRQRHGRQLYVGSSTRICVANLFSFSNGWPRKSVLQGNGAGPAIWLLISSPLINMRRTHGFGFQSSNLLADKSYTFACYTYVDDTDLVHNRMDTNPNQIIPDMQRMLDRWTGGLRATGGALVHAKSYWYGIDFKWNQKKLNWEYKNITELPGSLILRDHLQQPITLRRMEVHQANETLGLWIAADGNQIAQMQVLSLLIK
jgi:hypothetical protein